MASNDVPHDLYSSNQSHEYTVNDRIDYKQDKEGVTVDSRWIANDPRAAEVYHFCTPERRVWLCGKTPVLPTNVRMRCFYLHALQVFYKSFGEKVLKNEAQFGLFLLLSNVLWVGGSGASAITDAVVADLGYDNLAVRGELPVFPERHSPLESLCALAMVPGQVSKRSFPSKNNLHNEGALVNAWTVGMAFNERKAHYRTSSFAAMFEGIRFENPELFTIVSKPLEHQSFASIQGHSKTPYENAEVLEHFAHMRTGSSEYRLTQITIAEALVLQYVHNYWFLRDSAEGQAAFKAFLEKESHGLQRPEQVYEKIKRHDLSQPIDSYVGFIEADKFEASPKKYAPTIRKIAESGIRLPKQNVRRLMPVTAESESPLTETDSGTLLCYARFFPYMLTNA